MGLSAHQSARMKNDEWLTPPEILAKLGSFDLDPCAPGKRPWPTATMHYMHPTACTVCLPGADGKPSGLMLAGQEVDICRFHDGLALPWRGRVWLNPPFGREAVKWLRKMVAHGNGIALVPARTETAMFYECVWGVADAVCFIKGRPHFHYVTGERAKANSGAPIALIAYGAENAAALTASGLGFVVPASSPPDCEAIEREHFGDFDKQTGIYAKATESAALPQSTGGQQQ